MSETMRRFLVFDVESMGLHGEGFAVGVVVVDESGAEHDVFYAACPFGKLMARDEDHAWLRENCLPALGPQDYDNPRDVRDGFWLFWRKWADKGATMWVDCGWPVEARFLAACVDDDPSARWWQGPYPLNEIASLIGTASHPRLPHELPAHNPLNDARQSARLLVEHLRQRAAP